MCCPMTKKGKGRPFPSQSVAVAGEGVALGSGC